MTTREEKQRRKFLRLDPQALLAFIGLRQRIAEELLPLLGATQGDPVGNQQRFDKACLLMDELLPLIREHQHRLEFQNRSYVDLNTLTRLFRTAPRDAANAFGLLSNMMRVARHVLSWFHDNGHIIPSLLEIVALAAIQPQVADGQE